MTDLKQFENKNAIIVWQFDDAPEAWRKLSTNGGDEDWLAFVPDAVPEPFWIDRLGVCSLDRFNVEGGTVYIGSHA